MDGATVTSVNLGFNLIRKPDSSSTFSLAKPYENERN